jgi:hypothetical protein
MTESDDLRAEDDVVFALLGRTATNLSYLEFAVSELLQVLLDPNEPIVSALVTEEMPLARRIQNIRKLAALRFILDGAAKNRLINLANRLDGYKCKRNLFVHVTLEIDGNSYRRGDHMRGLPMGYQPEGKPVMEPTPGTQLDQRRTGDVQPGSP